MPVPPGYTLDHPKPPAIRQDAPARVPHESKDAVFPPALQRIQHAIGVQFVQGKPFVGYGGKDVIASVAEHEPHKIEINDRNKWNQGPAQLTGHELVHLMFNNLPIPLQRAVPPDNLNHPYDISDIDSLRSKGARLWTIPQEKAARLVQVYVSDPAQRKRLQPWIDDLNSVPLSTMNPTGPDDKTINTTVRPPTPPIEAFMSLSDLKAEAVRRNPRR